MDTEESNFRFFLKKRITIYPNLYKIKTVKSLLKRNNYSHEPLFQKQNINNLKQN